MTWDVFVVSKFTHAPLSSHSCACALTSICTLNDLQDLSRKTNIYEISDVIFTRLLMR